MSASREKKKRQNQGPAEVIDASAPKKGMGPALKKTLIAVVAIVIIAAIIFLGMVSTGFFAKHSTAAVVSGHKLTPAMVNYYYQNAYQSMSSYLSYVVDPDVPLDEQEVYEGTTWADYLLDMGLNNAASAYAVYDEAVANGFTLSEDSQQSIESSVQMYDLYASYYGYSSADAMLAYTFGTGCTTKSYQEFLTVTTTAQEYMTSVNEGFTYSQDDIDTYYSEHTEDFDAVTYRVFNISVASDAEDTEAALAECEETAKAMAEASQGNEEVFLELALENTAEESQETYDADTATLKEDYVKSSTSEAYQEWLFDAARQPGDATYVENGDTGYSVLYFVENVDHSYLLPNVRHILVYVSDTTDEDAMATAQEQAQALLNEFLAGDQTEEAFAALADENSYDTSEGGLIENVAPGVMVQSFEDWCYDESRQIGDTGIVESEYGYHVMLFCGYGMTYQDYTVESTMRTNDYNDWYADVTANASYETKAFPMRFATK